MTTSAIAVSGLRKAYGDKTVLDGVDLEVAQGSIFALLGPNGAGKTTTVNVLTTLIKADGGTARVAGHDVATKAKAVRALAMTLVTKPQIIFLDEPTTGLDPRSRRTMWDIVRELVADGVTAFLTTQYLEEADQLADRIAVLDHGRLVAEGTPDQLKHQVPGSHVRLRFADAAALEAAARVLDGSTADDAALAGGAVAGRSAERACHAQRSPVRCPRFRFTVGMFISEHVNHATPGMSEQGHYFGIPTWIGRGR